MSINLLARRTVRGYELRQGIEGYAQQMHAALGMSGMLRIVWANIGTASMSQSGVMTLASVRDDAIIDRPLLVRYVGFVLHELLHRRHTNFAARDGNQYIDRLHNAVEDIWIERQAINAGLTGNVRGILTDLVGQIVNESRATVKDWADPAQYPFVLAVHGRGYGPTVPMVDPLRPIFDEASRRIDGCSSSADTLEVARWVYTQINQAAQNPPPQPEDQSGDDKGDKGDKGDGQGNGQDDGQGNGQGDGQGTQSAGQQVRAPGVYAAQVEPTLDAGAAGGGAYWDGTGIANPGLHVGKYGPDAPAPAKASAKLRAEVRRLFEDTGHEQTSRNRKAGCINVHALPRHGVTDRVFQQRRDVEGVESAVVICLDVSGSMEYQLRDVGSVGHLFEDTLRSAGVATCIVTFGSKASVALPFGSNRAQAARVCANLQDGGATNDHAAIRAACDMLLARSETRKAIIVITDGDGYVQQCKAQIAAAENLGITVIGIGLRHGVDHVYKNAVRVDSVAELGNVMFKQIKMAA